MHEECNCFCEEINFRGGFSPEQNPASKAVIQCKTFGPTNWSKTPNLSQATNRTVQLKTSMKTLDLGLKLWCEVFGLGKFALSEIQNP